jgi:hypothetical protein
MITVAQGSGFGFVTVLFSVTGTSSYDTTHGFVPITIEAFACRPADSYTMDRIYGQLTLLEWPVAVSSLLPRRRVGQSISTGWAEHGAE